MATSTRQPTIYLPHGGGPCFFMEWTMGPPDTWQRMGEWLGSIDASLPETPRALLVVSAHWEAPVATVLEPTRPRLLFDYSGFPPHTYELEWPAPAAPAVAERVRALLGQASIATATETERGWDHGVFVPLKLTYPEANVPTVQLSLVRGLDPAAHLAIGRALAPLRDEGVLIVGSGMSYHNMRRFMTSAALEDSRTFDAWLTETASAPDRAARLERWADAPAGRASHPREEHLLPLMVCAGAAEGDRGAVAFSDEVMNAKVSALRFG
ncbi:MAG: dioxygenase [Sandaracinaceae bacterium]|nr:dioxygenase [Sandaracinaceae bacterium]